MMCRSHPRRHALSSTSAAWARETRWQLADARIGSGTQFGSDTLDRHCRQPGAAGLHQLLGAGPPASWNMARVHELVLNGIDATWLDEVAVTT
jgi:hypothetical protein